MRYWLFTWIRFVLTIKSMRKDVRSLRLQDAIIAIETEGISVREASRRFSIPKSTLQRKYKSKSRISVIDLERPTNTNETIIIPSPEFAPDHAGCENAILVDHSIRNRAEEQLDSCELEHGNTGSHTAQSQEKLLHSDHQHCRMSRSTQSYQLQNTNTMRFSGKRSGSAQ